MSLHAMVEFGPMVYQSAAALILDPDEMRIWEGTEDNYTSDLQRLYDFCVVLWMDAVLDEEPEMDVDNSVVWIGNKIVEECTGERLVFAN